MKAVIFDFDGVLVDSENINISAVRVACAESGILLHDSEIAGIPGRSSLDTIPRIHRARGIPSDRDGFVIERVRRHYDILWDYRIGLMPYAVETLIRLSDSKKLAIGTTNRADVLNRFFAKFFLRAYFSQIVTGEMVVRRKPDPAVYLLTAERLGISREEILVVEDSETGVVAGKAAGLKVAAIPNQYTQTQDFSKADFIFGSLKDLWSFC